MENQVVNQDGIYTVEQTAALLYTTHDYVRTLIKEKRLQATKIGKRYIILGSAIKQVLQHQESKRPQAV